MKQTLMFFTFLSAIPLFAQEEEVVFDKVTVHGGFGGPIVELTSMNDQTGAMAGGGGGVIVDKFFLGGFGQGSTYAEHIIDDRLYPINFGFGGGWFGFVTPTQKAIHFYSSLKIAGGEITLTDKRGEGATTLNRETVFVVQPEAGVELNLFKWFRIALAGNYRLVSGIQAENLAGLRNHDFNSGGMTLTLRFGKFYRNGGK